MKAKYLILLTALIILNSSLNAQGDLLITPKRVVFEGPKQKEEISLVNIGKDSATYSISFIQKNMREDGSFVTVVNPAENQMFADPYLRIFPRKVTLAPGEAQVIMLQCRRKPEMKAGEYRSHLYFRAEKNNTPLGMTNDKDDTTQVSVNLIPVFGVSIPVIIRSGEVKVVSAISDLRLENDGNAAKLNLALNRTGNISTFGDIKVEFVPDKGKSIVVGSLKGIGVYTSIARRNISLDLNINQGILLKNGKLRVLYTSQDGSRYEVFTESQILL
jgi:hypothetical protein